MGEVLLVDVRSIQGPTRILQIVDIGIGDLQVGLVQSMTIIRETLGRLEERIYPTFHQDLRPKAN